MGDLTPTLQRLAGEEPPDPHSGDPAAGSRTRAEKVPPDNSLRIGLALSGGGFRATLFHLGVVKYLFDVGLLPQVTHISSVSGGSLLAAHLALYWSEYLKKGFDNGSKAQEMIRFAQYDVRGKSIRRAFCLPRILPWLWYRWSPTVWLQYYYGKCLYNSKLLRDLDSNAPRLFILATDLESGKPCAFSRDGLLYDMTENNPRLTDIADQPIACAVAASSAFPVIFPPIQLTPGKVGRTKREFLDRDRLYLTDGGVYDNLGLAPFLYGGLDIKCDVVIVSDASHVSDWLELEGKWSFRRYILGLRASYDIAAGRLYELEKNSTVTGNAQRFVHICIDETVKGNQLHMATGEQLRLKDVRTDFDYFSGTLIRALVLHGQHVARQKLARIELFQSRLTNPSWQQWDPRPTEGAGEEVRLSADNIKKAKSWTGRLFAWDWPPLVNGLFLLIIVGLLVGLWWRTQPRKVAGLSISQISIFEADGGWLDPYRIQSFSEGADDRRAGKISDFQLIRLETNRIPHATRPFDLHISAIQPTPIEFRVSIFREHTVDGRLVNEPIPSQGGEPPPVKASGIKFATGDRLVIVGQVRSTTGNLPANLQEVKALIQLKILEAQ